MSAVTPHIARGRRLLLALFVTGTVVTCTALAGAALYLLGRLMGR
ncbi:hypothetical protein ACFRQM_22705 [Streptomyces sp. NPDC056831]